MSTTISGRGLLKPTSWETNSTCRLGGAENSSVEITHQEHEITKKTKEHEETDLIVAHDVIAVCPRAYRMPVAPRNVEGAADGTT